MSKSRESGIELLRIIAMIFIISGHIVMLCSWNYQNAFERTFHALAVSGHGAGVNIFFIITGYFNSKMEFKLTRLIRTWLPAFTYSVLIAIIFWAYNLSKFSLGELIKTLFPIICGGWTFVSVFVVVLCLQPILNTLCGQLERKEYKRFLIFLFLILSVLPILTTVENWYSYLAWGIYLYFVGGYLRIHTDSEEIKKHYGLIFTIMIIAFLIVSSSVLVISYCERHGLSLPFKEWYLTYKNTPPSLVLAFSAFLFFKELRIKSSIINRIAGHTYGIYLIHINRLMTDVLYPSISNMAYGGGGTTQNNYCKHINIRLLSID